MSQRGKSRGRGRLRVVGATVVVLLVLGAGGFTLWRVRQNAMITRAQRAGLTAYDRGDWDAARVMLGRYLSVHREDVEGWRKYAYAQVSARPVKPGNLRQAMSAYREILRLTPGDADAFRRVTRLYEQTGNAAELEPVADRRLAQDSDSLAAAVAKSKALVLRDKFDDSAVQHLRGQVERVAVAPADTAAFVDACLLLSGAPVRLDRDPEDWLRLAVERVPQSALARFALAAALLRPGADPNVAASEARRGQALETLRAAEDLAADEARVRILLAEQRLQLSNWDAAGAHLARARQIPAAAVQDDYPDPADWIIAQFVPAARLAIHRESGAQCAALAHRVLAELQDTPQRLLVAPLAIELLLRAHEQECVAQARQLLMEYEKESAKLPRPLLNEEDRTTLQALVAMAEGRPYEAIRLLAPLAARPSLKLEARTLLVNAYRQTDQPGAARSIAPGPVPPPDQPENLRLYARMCLGQGAYSAARQALSAIDPGDVELDLLRLAAELGELAGAKTPTALDPVIDELQKLRLAHPDVLELRLLLAGAFDMRQRKPEAQREFEQAVADWPDAPEPRLALAKFHSLSGNQDSAVATARAACDKHPESVAAWSALATLLATGPNLDAAREALESGLKHVGAQAQRETECRQLELLLAALDIRSGHEERGLERLRGIAARNKDDATVRMLLLENTRVRNDPNVAQHLVNELKAIEGPDGLRWRQYQVAVWRAADPKSRSHEKEIRELLTYCMSVNPRSPAAALMLGRYHEDFGQAQEAEAVYRKALSDCGAPELAVKLAHLLIREKQFGEATALLDNARQQIQSRALSELQLALALGAGRYETAVDLLQSRVDEQAATPEDYVHLAELGYSQKHDAKAALELLDQADAKGADPLLTTHTRVRILHAEQRTDDALALLKARVAQTPDIESQILLASYLAALQRNAEAEAAFRRVAEEAPGPSGYEALAEFQRRSGRPDAALATWEQALQKYPDSASLKRSIINARLLRSAPGDLDAAAGLLAALEKQGPPDIELCWLRALECLARGTSAGRQEAKANLRRALELGPTAAQMCLNLFTVARRLNQYELARECAERGLKDQPDMLLLLLGSAETELALGRVDLARQRVERALAIDAENLSALALALQIATLAHEPAKLNAGLRQLNIRVARDPNDIRANQLRARTLHALQRDDEAIPCLEQLCVRADDPNTVADRLLLAELCRAKGDATKARHNLESAVSLAPNSPEVLRAHISALARESKFDELKALLDDGRPAANYPALLLLASELLIRVPSHRQAALALALRAGELADDVPTYLAVGRLCVLGEDFDRAEQVYDQVLRQQSTQPDALNNKAWIMGVKRQAYADALALAQLAVQQVPGEANYRETLAGILRNLPGRLKDACEEYRRCAELAPAGSPLRAQGLLNAARLCRELNQSADAARYAERALAEDPDRKLLRPEERSELTEMIGRKG
jgi:Tfp pilus assembly protein PilF